MGSPASLHTALNRSGRMFLIRDILQDQRIRRHSPRPTRNHARQTIRRTSRAFAAFRPRRALSHCACRAEAISNFYLVLFGRLAKGARRNSPKKAAQADFPASSTKARWTPPRSSRKPRTDIPAASARRATAGPCPIPSSRTATPPDRRTAGIACVISR
jgi:hypothetical protein